MTGGAVSTATLAAIDGNDVVETFVSGIAVGCKYALVALGFVIIFKATGVINFAQASFVLVGAYLTYNVSQTWGADFYVALLAAMAAGFVLGVVLEELLLRRLIGEAPFTMIMLTIGILYVIDNVVTAIWGPDNLNLGDPWGIRTVEGASITVAVRDLWTMGLTAAVLAAFFLFFRYSKLGLAMRATALDQEVALAQGISARSVFMVSWGIAGAVAALAGATLAAGNVALQPGVGLIALVAFPAMILGGLESPLGAVVGGLIIGLVQQFTSLLAPEYFEWVGPSFEQVSPYLVMVLILLVRPYGLFGTKEVRRV
jgi:branched-chain amino acid transport system permease protein